MRSLKTHVGFVSVINLLISAILIVLFIGCATIMHGTKQEIGFSSSPTGATVTINGASIGNTPIVQKLSRGKQHIVRIVLDGYQPYETTIIRNTSGWVWGNIIFGGLIGLVVDAASGGLYELNPEQINANLAKMGVGFKDRDDIMYLTITMNPDPSWKKVGSLIPE